MFIVQKTFNINLVITIIVANNIKQAEINIMRFNLSEVKLITGIMIHNRYINELLLLFLFNNIFPDKLRLAGSGKV